MGYYIDLNSISIEQYKDKLLKADLIPSQVPLTIDIEKQFDLIQKQGIENIGQLLNQIDSKSKIEQFSQQSSISFDYLTLLSRAIRGYKQKPNRWKDFPELEDRLISKLEQNKIKNTFHFYETVTTKEQRIRLKELLECDMETIDFLTHLADLSRIQWVNHTFAYVLYKSGFNTTEEVASANPKELYLQVKQFNDQYGLYKGTIGLRDMKRCIEFAKEMVGKIPERRVKEGGKKGERYREDC